MNQQPTTDFEERLLSQLRAAVAERGAAEAGAELARARTGAPAWRRGPGLALGGAAILAAVAAGLVVSGSGDGTSAAFAVEPQEGGGVKIAIHSLSDPDGLEGALGEAGIASQVTYLPAGMTCREPHYRPSMVRIPTPEGQVQPYAGGDNGGPGGEMTVFIGNESQFDVLNEELEPVLAEIRRGELTPAEANDLLPDLFLDPSWFRSDQTLILSGSPTPYDGDPEGGSEMQVRIAEGEVGPCEPVPAPDGAIPLREPAGGWDLG